MDKSCRNYGIIFKYANRLINYLLFKIKCLSLKNLSFKLKKIVSNALIFLQSEQRSS